jgi:hypothetical protein
VPTSPNFINLIGADGKVYSGPVDQANELVKSGEFRFMEPSEAENLSMKDFASTPGEQIKNVASNYLSTSSFGATDLAARAMLPDDELKYEQVRREENPLGTIAGTGLGVVIDPLSGLGLVGKSVGRLTKAAGIEKLGDSVIRGSEAVMGASKYAPTRVVEEGAEALGKMVDPLGGMMASSIAKEATSPITHQVLSKIPGRAIRGSTIGGAFAAGQSISEQSLGDMDLNGERVFADGMNGAMLGLVFDTSLGALGDAAVGGTKKLYGALKNNDALANAYSRIISKFNSADEATIKATINAEREAQAVLNSAEKDIGALQRLESELNMVFGDGSNGTQAELGKKVTDGFAAQYKFVNDLYETKFKPLRETYGQTPLNKIFGDNILGALEKKLYGSKLYNSIEDMLPTNSTARQVFRDFKEDFLRLNSADDIWTLKQSINSTLSGRAASGFYKDTLLNREMGIIADAMNTAQDDALMYAARATGNKYEIKAAEDAANAIKFERESYGKDKQKLRTLAESLGMKNPNSFRAFVEKLKDMEGNVLVEKMFKARNNVEGLKFLQTNYPDQFANLANAFKNKIANEATKAGKFNPVKALELVSDKKLAPETRKLIFGEAGDDMLKNAAKAFHGETAENYARNQARKEMLLQTEDDSTFTQMGAIAGSIGGIPGAGAGAAVGKALDTITDKNKAARAFLGFEKAFKAFDEKIGQKAAAIFDKNPITARDLGKVATSSNVTSERMTREKQKRENFHPSELNHDQMIKNLSEWSENPDKLVEHLSNELGEMNNFAPGISQATQATAYRALDFLGEKLPVQPPRKPLDSNNFVVSKSDAYKFSRYYNTVVNPTGVLNDVRAGTLTNDHLETLLRVYPSLYKSMQEILMMEMIKYDQKKDKEALPSWKKLSISYFLENNLAAGLEQKNIGANFNNWLNPTMLSGQDGMGTPQSPSKGNQSGRNAIAASYSTPTQKLENEV